MPTENTIQIEHDTKKRRGEWITKICPSCGKEFETLKSKDKKYCSEQCNHDRNEKYMVYNCDGCGKEMRIKKTLYQDLLDGKRKSITCSYACMGIMKLNGHSIACENCGKELYRTQYHIDRQVHQFCSLICQKEYQHKEKFEIRKCEVCGKEFECSKISTQRFCSNICNSKWQTSLTKEKNSSFKSIKIPCTYCGKEHYVKPYKLEIQENFFCSANCRRSWFATVYSQLEETKNRSRETILKTLANNIGVNTKPQQIVDLILDENDIKYTREYNIKYYSVDNFLDESKLMIEVQGDYWHSNPLFFNTSLNKTQFDRIGKDKAKHTYIKNYYEIEPLYLWEHDINETSELCEALILLYIKNNGILNNYNSFNYHLDNKGDLCLNEKIVLSYSEQDIETYRHLYKEKVS